MKRLPLAEFTRQTLASLPDDSTILFYETPRSRKWVQAWRIDSDGPPDRPIMVWFGQNHLVGWFDPNIYVAPTLEHMARIDLDYKPVTEVRIYEPGEYEQKG